MPRFVLLLLIAIASVCPACDVPVFRYALERWAGDPFQLVVFHSEPIAPDLEGELQALETDPDPESKKVVPNWKIARVDTSKPLPKLWAALWESSKKLTSDAAKPTLALCTPEWRVGDQPMWVTTLSKDALEQLSDSAKRREIAKQLLAGTAVVWVLLESGDNKKDQALLDLVNVESERLRNTLPEPHGVEFDGVNVLSHLPISVSFSLVRFSSQDPSEAVLRKLLTNGDPISEPLLYPLFGRGRALGQFGAGKVDKGLLEETAVFLTSACSCQVKAQNPGFDILLKANWNSIFDEGNIPEVEAATKPVTKPIYVPLPKKKG